MFKATWQYINTHWGLIGLWTGQHLMMTAIGSGIAILIGISVGIYISRENRKLLASTVVNLCEILLTIPSLALYGILIPILASIHVPCIGIIPAIIALFLYGLLPIVENTYIGIKEVDPAIIEVARGMGMSPRGVLDKVKLPLAFPVIMAGIRNTIVMNIGIAALAVFVGAGGLGMPIFRGIRNMRIDLVLTGAIFAAALGVTLDILLGLAQRIINARFGGKVRK